MRTPGSLSLVVDCGCEIRISRSGTVVARRTDCTVLVLIEMNAAAEVPVLLRRSHVERPDDTCDCAVNH